MNEPGADTRDDDGDWLLRGSADVDDVTRFYDDWAGRYDDDLVDWSYEAPDVAARMLLEHGPNPSRVLDAGCGTGLVGRALRRAGHEGELVGIDVSAASLELADRTGAYSATRAADLQQPLGFDDGSFAGLICVGVMTYVPGVEAAWREFARVVAPGGVVVVTQREDLWDERECRSVIDTLSDEGVWTPIEVTEAQPYLPGNDQYSDAIGVHYVVARAI
ncbi:MAG: class I SAM-dependent methyltransferase [Ilumatobacteraceae bacterium]|nr:class I SAM-dependent methyltransferase [Ilumatobacteraceae bacterium]